MDETGNKESDRFFVCGFLRVTNTEQLTTSLAQVRDQIEAKSRFNKQKRIDQVKAEADIDQLYSFARTTAKHFELKYKHVSHENLHLFKTLLRVLFYKVDFKLDAITIDRNDPQYVHKDLQTMYKIITHQYFNHRCKEDCVFVPDNFDDHWVWGEVLNNSNIKTVIPGSSEAFLPLQAVDILTGIIGQGLKDASDYTNKDKVREPLVNIFEEESGLKIELRSKTVNKPRYISIWPLDFSKTKKGGS